MPFSTNTKNNDFGHAQVLRDIEYLYLYLKGDTPGYVNQSIQDDGITGESLDNRIINLGGGNSVTLFGLAANQLQAGDVILGSTQAPLKAASQTELGADTAGDIAGSGAGDMSVHASLSSLLVFEYMG